MVIVLISCFGFKDQLFVIVFFVSNFRSGNTRGNRVVYSQDLACFWCQSFGDVSPYGFSSVLVAEWPPFEN